MFLIHNSCSSFSLFLHRSLFFFFNDTATTEIYTLSLHDALPICSRIDVLQDINAVVAPCEFVCIVGDRKSTRLNSSHSQISYAVFCLKKKKKKNNTHTRTTS